MRFGELVKAKCINAKTCCLVQAHSSAQTGARKVNAMVGGFSRGVWWKSKYNRTVISVLSF